jgi:hypothetical protein
VLPPTYGLPAAILIVLGGTLACFAGYRLFRIVAGIYGFILGAMIASSLVDVSGTMAMLLAALLGGVAGALVLVFAYLAAIALAGGALGALLAHLIWSQIGSGEPPAVAVIAAAIIGAAGAMLVQRYVLVVATAFGGAWTVIVGGVAVAAHRGVKGLPASGDAWILYPLHPAPGETWVPVAWIALGLVGTIVQLALGRKKKK